MNAGLEGRGGAKWSKICACTNSKLWRQAGGTRWSKIHMRANNQLWAPSWGGTKWAKICLSRVKFCQFACAQRMNLSQFGASLAWRLGWPPPPPLRYASVG